MKTLLEILGIRSMSEKEEKLLQDLRDEALKEKAGDELSESNEEGIGDVLIALREERTEERHSPTKSEKSVISPAWTIGFASVICIFSFSFLIKNNPPSTPIPLTSSIQNQSTPEFAKEGFFLDPSALTDALPLPSDDWLENLNAEQLHASLPIRSIATIYEEFSTPSTLSDFEFPAFSDSTLILYQEEGLKIKRDLTNGLGFLLEALPSFDFQIEG